MIVSYHHRCRLLLLLLVCLLAKRSSIANAKKLDLFEEVGDEVMNSTNHDNGEEDMVNIMVGFRDEDDEDKFIRKNRMEARTASSSKSKIKYKFKNTNGLAMQVTRSEFEKMKKDRKFSTIEEDFPVRVASNRTANFTATMEAHERWLNEIQSYGLSMTQSDVPIPPPPSDWSKCVLYVCIVDSGVYVDHQDIPYNRNDGYSGGKEFGDASGDQWYNPVNTPHGTNVAGIMFATGGNNAGMVGVIPQHPQTSKVCLRVAKVFPNGKEVTSVSAILEAVDWCASQRDNEPMVINLSIATELKTSTEEKIYKNIYEKGILIVAAAGNAGNNVVSYPASHNSVISVASVNKKFQRSSFSQYNSYVEIAGPGTDVAVTFSDGSTVGTASGTSFATPYVAAIAARIWARNPHCSNKQVRKSLRDTAVRLGDGVPNQEFGYGLVQAVNAYNNLNSKNCNQPTPFPTPFPTRPPTPPPTPYPTTSPSKNPTATPSGIPTMTPSISPTGPCQSRLGNCATDEDCCRGLVCQRDSSMDLSKQWVCRSGTDSGMRNKPRLSSVDGHCRGGFAGGCGAAI